MLCRGHWDPLEILGNNHPICLSVDHTYFLPRVPFQRRLRFIHVLDRPLFKNGPALKGQIRTKFPCDKWAFIYIFFYMFFYVSWFSTSSPIYIIRKQTRFKPVVFILLLIPEISSLFQLFASFTNFHKAAKNDWLEGNSYIQKLSYFPSTQVE